MGSDKIVNEVKEIVDEFYVETLSNTDPKGLCLIVSYVISTYLNALGYHAKICEGTANDDLIGIPHYLSIIGENSDDGLIIDLTIKQFKSWKSTEYVFFYKKYEEFYCNSNLFRFRNYNEKFLTQGITNFRKQVYINFISESNHNEFSETELQIKKNAKEFLKNAYNFLKLKEATNPNKFSDYIHENLSHLHLIKGILH